MLSEVHKIVLVGTSPFPKPKYTNTIVFQCMAKQYFSFSQFSVLENRGSDLFLQYLKKNYNFKEYFSFKTTLFIASKHLKVFSTSVFSETEVFSEYFKNILMSNGASFFHLFCLGYPMIFIEM
jgi:hypothetical protein